MKLKHLLALASLVIGGGNLWADDVFKDITSQYLTNADFEGEFEETTNPGKASGNKIAKPNGWTLSFTGASSDGTDCVGMNSSYAAWSTITSGETLPTNGGNNTYWVRMKWGTTQILKLFQKVTLPLGTYALTSDYYKNGLGGDGNIYANSNEAKASNNENVWKTVSLTFTSDGSTSTEIGLKVVHTSSGSDKKLAFDNFKLEWNLTQSLASLITSATSAYEAGGSSDSALKSAIDDATAKKSSTDADVLENAYNALKTAADLTLNRQAWSSAKSAAEAAIDNNDYSVVTGEERTALQTEIGKTEPTTAEGYDNAKLALENATSTFTAAKSSYDAFEAAKSSETPELPYAATAKKTALTNTKSATATSAADAEAKTEAITTALRAYYESNAMGEAYANALNLTSKLTNPTNPTNTNGWTINNTSGNCGMRIQSGEPYTNSDGTTATGYFDSNSWNKAFTSKFTQEVELEAGKYILTVKSRGNGINTYQVIAGEESTDMPIMASTGGVFGKGWNDYTVEFELNAKGTVALGVYMDSGNKNNWLSFGDFRLVRLELYTEKATASDYESMAAALASAKVKTLGFDVEEYAPYNNVEAIAAIAAAEAVNTEIDNPKEDIEAITTALGNWTANSSEINAFYDGDFAIQDEHTTGPTALTGWNNPQGIRQLIKNTETYPGLSSATGNAAVFAWGNTTMFYGETEGYTLPLNAHTIYELSFKTCGWIDGDMGYVNVDIKNASNEGLQTVSTATATKRIGEENPWDEFKIIFVTGEAGNYKFGMWTSKHTTFTDLVLKKAANQYLEFADNATMPKYAAGTYPSVKITRNLTAGRWATAVYPFAVSGVDEIAMVDSYDKATGALGFKTATASEANVPFLMRSTADATEITMNNVEVAVAAATDATVNEASLKGVYTATDITNAEKNYVLSNNKIFSVGTAGATINPYRAYIQITQDAAVKALTFFVDGEETAIEGVNSDDNVEGAIYNLAGQRMNSLKKGINIVGGKKILVK